MKLETFFENFEQLASAPNGVQKMRELILQLAVQGKLASQDTNDEPTSELLKRIMAEKMKQRRIERVKARQLPAGDINAHKPFAAPDGWEWVTLDNLVTVLNGRAYSKSELLDKGTPVLRVGNLFTSTHWYYSNLELEEDKYCESGDLLYAWSASFGPFIWQGPKVIYHYHIWKLKLHSAGDLDKNYLYWFLLQKTQEIKDAGHGVSMLHMTKEKMERILVPLPPLAEQRRIVAKVDQLMALCNELEALQQQQQAACVQVNNAALDRLLTTREPEEFAEHWQRICDNFDLLYGAPETVGQLRQAVLQLAVHGKLVPQSENYRTDEMPLSELLKENSLNGIGIRPNDSPPGVPILRISAGTSRRDGIVDEQDYRFIEIDRETLEQYKLLPGDLLACRFNGNLHYVGMFSLYIGYSGVTQVYPDKLIRFRVDESKYNPAYVRYAMNSAQVRASIEKMCATTAGNIGISATNLKTVTIPLPPLEMQQAIVAKVVRLMALCDELEAKLKDAQAVSGKLLEATVNHLLTHGKTRGAAV